MAAQPKPVPAIHKNIELYPDGHADKEREYLNKNKNEHAMFSATNSDCDLRVVFTDDTPFYSSEFLVPARGKISSGPAREDVHFDEPYRYVVFRVKRVPLTTATGTGADPEIIITR